MHHKLIGSKFLLVWRVSTHQPLTSKNRVAGFSYLVPQICTSTWHTTTDNYYTRLEWKKTRCCDGRCDKVHSRIGWALSHGGIWANAFGCQNTRELSSPRLFQVTLSMVGRGKNNWEWMDETTMSREWRYFFPSLGEPCGRKRLRETAPNFVGVCIPLWYITYFNDSMQTCAALTQHWTNSAIASP